MTTGAPGAAVRAMRLRYAGTCACGTAVPAGTSGGYDRLTKQAVCPACLPARLAEAPAAESDVVPAQAPVPAVAPTTSPTGTAANPLPAEPELYFASAAPARPESGSAGGSARAEYERRSARREARIRAAHPKLGGLILAFTDDPQSTRAWGSGAVGEERVGARLDGLAGDKILVLHDRRIPGSRANIDHIAIGPGGVFVIDAKRYNDAKIEVRRSGGWRSPLVEKLYVGGRDRTKLVTDLGPQVAAVLEALDEAAAGDGDSGDSAALTVQPVLAFVDAVLPLLGTLEIAGVPVLGPRGIAKLVRRDGPLSFAERQGLHALLAERLPAYKR